MREPDFRERSFGGFRWSWTVTLIASYLAVLLAELFTFRFYPLSPAAQMWYKYFALSREGLEHGYVWQLVTYQFMHAGWLHLIVNSWAILVFGRELERNLGGKKFLTLMFASGIIGGIFQMLLALLLPQFFDGPVVGASAGAFGLVAAYAALFPERELTLLVFFVIPVTVTATWLLVVSAVAAVAEVFFPSSHVANAAHLGGMVAGWFYVRGILQGDWSRLGGGHLIPKGRGSASREELETGDSPEAEVDPILEKISAQGIQSLTAREREILESARKKMSRR